MGRPIEFDSEVADYNTMLNAFGNVIKPIKLSTCCPECGQGLEYDIYLAEPPFSVVSVKCYYCTPDAPPQADPFMNPVDDGRIPEHDLDPLLHDPNQQVIDTDYTTAPGPMGNESSVADRLNLDSDLKPQDKTKKAAKKTEKKKTAKKTSKAKKIKKKAKEKPLKAPKPPKPPVNKRANEERAEGVGGEEQEDLEDLDDLVEQE